jgi:GDP-L-fucose synthase
VVGYRGKIVFDAAKLDGTPRKLMDSSRIAALGWKPEISLEEGIEAPTMVRHQPRGSSGD